MRVLIQDLIPHAPHMGLYVTPSIPPTKVRNAIKDYAPGVVPARVLALYDGTLMGSAKDGALFTDEVLVFQNSDLEAPQQIRYREIVNVERKKGLLKGNSIVLEVNRGRATFSVKLNLSAKPRATEYLFRFLKEVMLLPEGNDRQSTDWPAVHAALDRLREDGRLSAADYSRLLREAC